MKLAVTLLILALSLRCSGPPSQEIDRRPKAPNIILIVADDLGYGDVGAYGGTTIRTPHIDALAAAGIRFTDGYVSASVCSPSRAGLYTGRYQQRFGYEYNTSGRDNEVGLPLNQRTFADMMKAAGYATGLVGKWHQGLQRKHHPLNRGFDEYFGVLHGGTTYIDSRVDGVEFAALGRGKPPTERGNPIYDGFEEVEVEDYLTDVFTKEAISFIDRHQSEPFFLVLSHIAPHTPLQATAEYTQRYRDVEPPRNRVYSAMVAALDDSVGRVVATLKKLSLEEDTLVVFLSDNGCTAYVQGACSNEPLSGFKRYQWEGGVRVPFIAKWPNGLPAGKDYQYPVVSLDLFSTLAAAAGSEERTEDSINLLPYLRGEELGPPHEFLFWRSKPNVAVRFGNWKLWRVNRSPLDLSQTGHGVHLLPGREYSGDSPHGQVTLLYDLSQDIGERRNLAAEFPDIVKRLEAAIAEWDQQLVEPMWPAGRSTLDIVDGQTIQLYF